MHEEAHKRSRYVIPRWRPVARTVFLGEAAAVSGPQPSHTMPPMDTDQALVNALATFHDRPGKAFAAEAMAAAVLAGQPEAAEAPARRVLDAPALTSGLVSLANACVDKRPPKPGPVAVSVTRDYIRSFRTRLRGGRVGAHAWLDLALAHTSVGSYGRAEQALKVARALMPHPTRLLLRAEARFYQHNLKPGQALHVLAQQIDMVLSDPWLLAAEIGLRRLTGSTSRHVKRAQRMIDGDISPFHLSELAAAVGTEELMAGSHKRARRLFRAAVEDPAEQGLAQTIWARQLDSRITPPAVQTLRRSAEARARDAIARSRWRQAVSACWDWQAEELFASMPAIMLSTILSVYLGNFDAALKVADQGLMFNPGDPYLFNNKAFILARMGRLEEADAVLAGLDTAVLSEPLFAVLIGATAGLISIRGGLVDQGRRLYRRAYEMARLLDRSKGSDLAPRVAVFFTAEARALGVLDDEIDASMLKQADPGRLKGNLAELHKVLARHVRPPRLGRQASVHDLVRNILEKLE